MVLKLISNRVNKSLQNHSGATVIYYGTAQIHKHCCRHQAENK